MRVRLIDSVDSIDPAAWDALAGRDDPFVEHAFLSTLEESGSVGGDSGWEPLHVTVEDGHRLVGALPLYLKDHSFGEYIFDWGWAEAAMRLGVRYYPKLVSMVPVTPVTGRRFLVHPEADRPRVVRELLGGCFEAAEQTRASSIHLHFLNEEERAEVAEDPRFMSRLSMQFHWHNQGWKSFDDYLRSFRAPARKQVRRERRRAAASGLELRTLAGEELDETAWEALHLFYRVTCMRYGSHPYLTPRFFELMPRRLAHRVVVAAALDRDGPVAASLNFEKGRHLYGRYWGCRQDIDAMHFELCYYRPLERAIERGMERFEAGAQGGHKLRRGLMPSPVYSAHWLRHPMLATAVGDFLIREQQITLRRIGELARHGPFKRGDGD